MLLVGAQLAFGQAAEQNSNQAALPQSQQNTTEAEGIAEIVVTSQRRAQNLQDVPVAVTAVVGDTLLERGVVNLTDLPNLSPGLRVANPGNPAVITISIRGVGQRDINIHNEGAVALFVDGAYVSFTGALGQPLFDLDRVEVLKGQQGTLFGRNATGGVIQAISKKPTDNWMRMARLSTVATMMSTSRAQWVGRSDQDGPAGSRSMRSVQMDISRTARARISMH
jgi:iron complex outermembrane receptor protein